MLVRGLGGKKASSSNRCLTVNWLDKKRTESGLRFTKLYYPCCLADVSRKKLTKKQSFKLGESYPCMLMPRIPK